MIQSSDSRGINFHVITLFPEMIEGAVSFGVIGQAIKNGSIAVSTLSPRVFTSNVHQTVDDRPFGGGDGMVMLAEPLALATEAIFTKIQKKPQVIHLSPRGVPFTDAKARELARESDLILIASRYGGVDQRFLNEYVNLEVSIGDYVLSGGELGALVVIDSVSRHIPGVLGNETSPDEESFSPHGAGLEYPQFSRPREWRSGVVPDALLSGNHARIKEWKEALSLLVTLERRPELLSRESFKISDKLKRAAEKILLEMSDEEIRTCGLHSRELILKRLKVEV